MKDFSRGKRVAVTAALAVIVLAAAPMGAGAQVRSGLGVGIQVGEPTGLAAINWLGGGNAVDMVAAWSFVGGGSVYFHADYQFHNFVENPLSLFAGVGGFIVLQDNPLLGIRVPLGLTFLFQEAPLDVFLEVAPGITLAPATDFFVNGGIGIRFYL